LLLFPLHLFTPTSSGDRPYKKAKSMPGCMLDDLTRLKRSENVRRNTQLDQKKQKLYENSETSSG